jgi:hypothetical protein
MNGWSEMRRASANKLKGKWMWRGGQQQINHRATKEGEEHKVKNNL